MLASSDVQMPGNRSSLNVEKEGDTILLPSILLCITFYLRKVKDPNCSERKIGGVKTKFACRDKV